MSLIYTKKLDRLNHEMIYFIYDFIIQFVKLYEKQKFYELIKYTLQRHQIPQETSHDLDNHFITV